MRKAYLSALLLLLACLGTGLSLAEDAPKAGEAQTATAQKELYRCPMHPEVTSEAAGRCPKCKMYLEKVEQKAAPEAEHKEH